MRITTINTSSQNNYIIPSIFVIFFLLNSFLSLIYLTVLLLGSKTYRQKYIIFWGFLVIFFISLYNATKLPENDLEWYVDFYLMAGRISFVDYIGLLTGGKEILYQCFVYFIYWVGGDNEKIFIFVISLCSYIFLFKALFLLAKTLRLCETEIIFCCFVLFFFPYIYALSVHLVRQFLATSIMLYVICKRICEWKINWWLIIVAILIHTSTVFFVPFIIWGKFKEKVNFKNGVFYLGGIIFLLFMKYIANFILPFFTGTFLFYLVNKVALGTTYETTLPMLHLFYSIILVLIDFGIIYIFSIKYGNDPKFVYFFNITFFLLLFIMVNGDQPELQLRYNFNFWLLTPFFFCFFIKAVKINVLLLRISCIFLFLFWNVYNISMSEWNYTCANEYFLYPFYFYLL